MTQVSAAAKEAVRAEVALGMDLQDIPGVVVGVTDRMGPVWSVAFGSIERVGDRRISTDTMFSLQSISKFYTATAVMGAVADQLVELDEPITTYLPDFTVQSEWESTPASQITMKHLLSHRAGLVHEAPRGSNFDGSDTSFDDHCASISETSLLFPVGTAYSYSNLGIDLAALIIQRVSGLDFPTYVDRRLLAPLNLHRTTFDPTGINSEPDRAVGHRPDGAPPDRIPMIGAAGGYASIDDALRFLTLHLSGGQSVISSQLLRQMYEVPGAVGDDQLGYGLGIDTQKRHDRLVRNHSGQGFGFLCDVVWDADLGVGVVVMTNSEGHSLHTDLSTHLLDQVVSEALTA